MTNPARHEAELWDEFHRVVNMTSRELAGWLRSHSEKPIVARHPAPAGTPSGPEVLRLLSKRRADLTPADLQLMRTVVRRVHIERRGDHESGAGRAAWRKRLMSLGHDPLKPS